MNTPNLDTHPAHIEELRIGGGFGSAPDGGLDCDNTGTLAMDGDLTVGGDMDLRGGILHNSTGGLELNTWKDTANTTVVIQNSHATHKTDVRIEGNLEVNGKLTLGATGADKTWFLSLNVDNAFRHSTQGPAGPFQIEFGGGFNTVYKCLDFSPDVKQFAHWNIFLPKHYDGSPLKVKLFWTATTGTAGQIARWRAYAGCLTHADALSYTLVNNAVLESPYQTPNTLHTVEGTFTPDNALLGGMIVFVICRQGDSVLDTFTASSKLLGVSIEIE